MIIGAFACQKHAPARLCFSLVALSFRRVFVVRECNEEIQPIKTIEEKSLHYPTYGTRHASWSLLECLGMRAKSS